MIAQCFRLTGAIDYFTAVTRAPMISIVVSMAQSVRTSLVDPLPINASLAFSRNYYPVGFPLRLATNSPDVMAAVNQQLQSCKKGVK